jgi:hypothetical protein
MPMQQLNKVYYPIAEKTEFVLADEITGEHCFLQEHKDVLIVTIKQLKEVYQAGGFHMCAISEGDYSHSFEKFIQSKGITL